MKKGLAGVSAATVVFLFALLGAILVAIFAIFKLPLWWACIGAVALIGLQFLLNPWLTDLTMRWFYKAKFGGELPPFLDSFIRQTCEKNNMKLPKIGFIQDGAPNAFTYGRTKNSARIILTRGLLEMLDEEELKGVVAHELGHATHYDMLLMTVVQLVPFVLLGIYEACIGVSRTASKPKAKSGSGNNNSGGGILVIVGLVALVLYAICQLVILWLSRTREYFADQFAYETTGDPNSLASALVKIGLGLSTRESVQEGKKKARSVASPTALGISDKKSAAPMTACSIGVDGKASPENIRRAMNWERWNLWAKLHELANTHPLTSKRLLALAAAAPQYGQTPYVQAGSEKKPAGLGGLFCLELIISLMSLLFLIVGIAASIALAKVIEPLNWLFYVGVVGAGFFLLCLVEFFYRHPKEFRAATAETLLGELRVSNVTAIPCKLTGKLIGRGDPGCIFNENFVLHDGTGILLLNYNQPLKTMNKFFALFRSKQYLDQDVTVTGWFRRGPTPYVDMLDFTTADGTTKKMHGPGAAKIALIVCTVLFAALAVLSFFL